jgi:hypothetical protein
MCATGIVPALHDAPLRDRDGALIGSVEDLLCDDRTNRPAWLVVRLADGRRTVAPARGSRPTPDGIRLRHPFDAVRTCPVTLAGPVVGREHLVRLCRHYGLAVAAGAWCRSARGPRAPQVLAGSRGPG